MRKSFGLGRRKLVPLGQLLRPAATAALLSLWTTAGVAQDACESGLRQAEESYELGLLEDVVDQVRPCLSVQTSRATAIRVHVLLARAYLASDDLVKARAEVSILLRIDSNFEPPPPPRLGQLVAQVRREQATVQVASVSKTKESLREAPATVLVMTADEIERRGYLDLEQLLHDLPGFDIAKVNGDIYSFIYQRGYRSRYNDRGLLLLDGLEQNALDSNTLYLSRQYPMSAIDRVEIVYGPASTMYGANAYTGVINVITKEAETLVAENRRFGFTVQAGAGSFSTRSADLTLAGKDHTGSLAWSLTGHFVDSDELDLSRYSDWDSKYDDVDYRQGMRLDGSLAGFFASQYPCGPGASPYYDCVADEQGNLSVELTDEGERLVRDLDWGLLQSRRDLTFSDHTRAWSLYGKVRLANLTLGLELWRTEEGASPWVSDRFFSGRANWAPRQSLFYLKYSRPVGRDLTFNAFSRFQQSGIDRNASRYVLFHNYANGFLSLFSLAPPCSSLLDPRPIGCPAEPWLEEITYGGSSNQIRNELSLVYDPPGKLSALAGIELSKSSIQSENDQTFSGPFGVTENRPVQSEHTDAALYGQASYKPRQDLRLVLAGRLHHNAIDNRLNASGFGTLFIPRAAVIYLPAAGRLVFKAIYSEAFKDPTDFEKFGVVQYAREVPAMELRPERVTNIEVSAGWHPSEAFYVDLAAYQADYRDIVGLQSVPAPQCTLPLGCFQLRNRDAFHIRGVQLDTRFRFGRAEAWGNYTFTDPAQTHPKDGDGNPVFDDQGRRIAELRIADIASHRFNLGLGFDWNHGLRTDLRLQYVGSRRTGPTTTVPFSPFRQIGAYTVVDATASYRTPLPGTTLQVIAGNLLGQRYFDPGTQLESVGAPRVPQAGRTIYLRLTSGFARPRAGGGEEPMP